MSTTIRETATSHFLLPSTATALERVEASICEIFCNVLKLLFYCVRSPPILCLGQRERERERAEIA